MNRPPSSSGFARLYVAVCLFAILLTLGLYFSNSTDEFLGNSSAKLDQQENSSLILDTSEPVQSDFSALAIPNEKDRPANFRLLSPTDLKSIKKETNDSEGSPESEETQREQSEITVYETVGKKAESSSSSQTRAKITDAPLFTPDELRELQRSARARRLSAPGGPPVPTNRRDEGVSSDEDSTAEEEQEEEQEEEARPLFGGQARGYTLLSLMHPRARESSERHVELLIKSRVARLLLGVLVDGTFSYDQNYFASVVRRLGSGDQRLTLVVYLTNGPTMRRFDVTPITAGFARVDPDDFRDRIRFDESTRERFAEFARRVRPILLLNRSLNPANRNIVIPMLEDNLTAESYTAARTLARSILGDVAEFVRNPCPGCWDGNDTESGGDALELHSISSLELLNTRDFFSLDGIGFRFSAEPQTNASELETDAVLNLIDFSRARGLRGFALWRFDRQGLSGGAGVHPDDRVYAAPNPQFEAEELALLRHNLIEVVQDGTTPAESSGEEQVSQ